MTTMPWNQRSKEIFDKVIGNLPQFHRSIAEKLVKESAENLARERGVGEVEESDLIKAFFKEVPPAFKDMMTRLFEQLKVEYKDYV
jgi:hypothetical protein